MLNNRARLFSASLFLFGTLGVVVSLLGELTTLGEYRSEAPRSWERFDGQSVIEMPDIDSLEDRVDSLISPSMSEQEKMEVIYGVVVDRFSHGDQAKYNLFSNWFLWLMSKVSPEFAYIRRPSVLVGKGHSALCSEQSYLLLSLAEAKGVRTRHVGLNGHVVMEAWYDGDWHMYDPDLEVIPAVTDEEVLSLDELAKSPDLIREFYSSRGSQEYVEEIVRIIGSREDNSFVSYPRLALFEWKSNVLFHWERVAGVLKWLIPMMLLILALGIEIKTRKQ